MKRIFRTQGKSSTNYMGLFDLDLTDWWLITFNDEERKIITSLFLPNTFDLSGKDHNNLIFSVDLFYIKHEAVIPFMDGLAKFYLNKHEYLAKKVFEKFIDISNMDPVCDSRKLREDKKYRNWFILRNLVFHNIYRLRKMNVQNVGFSYGNYEPAPEICKKMNGKVFNLEKDMDLILQHWSDYMPECRCALLPEIEDGILID